MVPPKATFHSQEYKDMRYTDLAKEAQGIHAQKHAKMFQGHSHHVTLKQSVHG